MSRPAPDCDPLADQLRRAARTSGRSTSDIARDAGMDRRQLARFLSGARRQLFAGTAEALAEALGLRLSLAPAAARRKPGYGNDSRQNGPLARQPLHIDAVARAGSRPGLKSSV